MLNLNAKIIVYETDKLKPTDTKYEFRHVKNVEINSSYKTLTDTATITMPKKVFTNFEGYNFGQFAKKPEDSKEKTIHDFFKLESFVEIYLGYNGDYKPAFTGYITSVKGDSPVTIECQDAMYACKKMKAVEDNDLNDSEDECNIISQNPTTTVEKFNPKTYFEKRLKDLGFPFKIDALDEELGDILVKRNQSVCQVFEGLKEKGIQTYFKTEKDGPILTITNNPQQYDAEELSEFTDRNFIETAQSNPIVKKLIGKGFAALKNQLNDIASAFTSDLFLGKARFKFHHNIISDDLKVVEEAVKNTRFRVEKFFGNSNTSINTEVGDRNGQLVSTQQLHDSNEMLPNDKEAFKNKVAEITSELTQYASKRAIENRPNGLEGSFTTFGEPFVRPTDKVVLENAEDKEKNGTFQVTKVIRTYGDSGYRQKIHLGRIVKEK